MKKYKITEEQIKQLDELTFLTSPLRKWFPEAFEKHFELNQWYTTDEPDNFLVFVVSITDNDHCQAYGFNTEDEWFDEDKCGSLTKYRLATHDEILNALTKEATRRGLVKGSKVISAKTGRERIIGSIGPVQYFDDAKNKLYSYGVCIYSNGKWATIVEERTPLKLTIAQVSEKFGQPVKIIG